ncbi:MAG: hypothetical protein AABZ16_02765, partial [candidate division NC10 bacterium]
AFHRHEPEKTVLYQIVQEHMNTFFEIADARSGSGCCRCRFPSAISWPGMRASSGRRSGFLAWFTAG